MVPFVSILNETYGYNGANLPAKPIKSKTLLYVSPVGMVVLGK